MQSVYRRFPIGDGSDLLAYASFAPEESDDNRSKTTHQLPDGEVIATIDASGRAVHGYLHYLITDAVAYTMVVNIDAKRASVLASVFLGLAVAGVATGRYYLSVPLFGAGSIVTMYVAVYWLASRGVFLNLSRRPEPPELH